MSLSARPPSHSDPWLSRPDPWLSRSDPMAERSRPVAARLGTVPESPRSACDASRAIALWGQEEQLVINSPRR